MATAGEAFSGGFREPVLQAQSVFRLLMEGMARPGSISAVSGDFGQPAPLGDAAAAIALTVCDHETPVWLAAGLQKSAVGEWIAFHTGAPLTREKAEARFAFIEAEAGLASFSLFSRGVQDYPDRSTTLVIEIAALGSGRNLVLTGPGIKQAKVVAAAGIPDIFFRLWAENLTLFPLGVDVVLVAGRQMLCLPRTTRIAVE